MAPAARRRSAVGGQICLAKLPADSPPSGNGVTVGIGPGADGRGIDLVTVVAHLAAVQPGGPHAPAGADVRSEYVAQGGGVLLAEVYLERPPVEGESHRLLGGAAGQVVFKLNDRSSRH